MATIFISTGEVSGDLQGALLVEALYRQGRQQGLDLEILALGGQRMADAGATLLGQTTGIGSVGLFEALPFVLPTLKIQEQVKRYLRQNPPDLIILIDYMGPNLSIGGYLRRHLPQVPIVYYIAPQLWVWSQNQRDTQKVAEITDLLLAIFPEEARYFGEHQVNVNWVGHPLIDRMQGFPSRSQARVKLGIPEDQKAIALMPASRRQELKYLMPVMFAAAQQIQQKLPEVKFWIPLSLAEFREPIERAIADFKLNATLVDDQVQEVLAGADLAICKSGTVNLELALLDVPQVVMYRLNALTAWIARYIVKLSLPYVSPANLVEMKPIVPEFLQEQATPEALSESALELLLNPQIRQETLQGYSQMRQALGQPGVCDRAATAILEFWRSAQD
ncbi:lipid-A-disaccharide synthase [Roseofilum sp. BLCC_M154]|uniref:Lipid-A-disaccharide synthase n=1 Tax=Roseofilum acuticapitatum BLCC-M154 TaxID=3022444 RepID=A0ABT7AZ52_9CYAN|nr:lipid-A-disaccharide synthase [Roseofilum acuticapitatum]MDJ1172179.1 lipid-A-disaccharide synthase [Roseofilum acuticapitatum BLCC-M154]